MKQKHLSACLFKILLHIISLFISSGAVCSQTWLLKSKASNFKEDTKIFITLNLFPGNFLYLSCALKKYKPVLSEVAASFTCLCLWGPELSSDVRGSVSSWCCGHLKSVITQRLCLLHWNSQVL